jgi:hypothetical protein
MADMRNILFPFPHLATQQRQGEYGSIILYLNSTSLLKGAVIQNSTSTIAFELHTSLLHFLCIMYKNTERC